MTVVVFDLETTGTDIAKDRIVSIALKRCSDLSGFVEDEFYSLVNPGIPIPKESSDVHGITDGMVANAPTFQSLAPGLHKWLEGVALAGFNLINFDVPLLWEEFNRAGVTWNVPQTIIDFGNIFKKKEERSLSAAVRFYCGREMVGAHSAEMDVAETVNVMVAQLERYADLPRTVEELAAFSRFDERIDLAGKLIRVNGVATYNFGKHKGTPVSNENGFAYWMLDRDFPVETKMQLIKVLNEISGK